MPKGSLSGFHPPNINSTYHMLKDALEGAGEPSKSAGGLAIEPPPSQTEIGTMLFRLISKAPEKAAEVLASMGVGPEDFIAAITEHDAAQGLSFDVDEERLATATESMNNPESPGGQFSQLVGGKRWEQGEPQVPGVEPGNRMPRPALEIPNPAPPLERVPEKGAQPQPVTPDVAPPANIPPPPTADIPVEGEHAPQPAPAPPAEEGTSGLDTWLRKWLPNPYPNLDVEEAAPQPTAPASPVSGAPPQPAYVPTASYEEGGSSNTGLPVEVAAAPVQQDALAQKANLASRLGAILEGVGQVGDPAMPEVATPSAPGGAGGIQQGQLLELLARANQSNPSSAIRLGQALSLGR